MRPTAISICTQMKQLTRANAAFKVMCSHFSAEIVIANLAKFRVSGRRGERGSERKRNVHTPCIQRVYTRRACNAACIIRHTFGFGLPLIASSSCDGRRRAAQTPHKHCHPGNASLAVTRLIVASSHTLPPVPFLNVWPVNVSPGLAKRAAYLAGESEACSRENDAHIIKVERGWLLA